MAITMVPKALKITGLIIISTLIVFTYTYIASSKRTKIEEFGWSANQALIPFKVDQASDLDHQKYRFRLANSVRVAAIRKAAKANQLDSLEMYIVPQVTCPTMVRVGGVGDGGKWVCNPWRAPKGCVIYSLGVSGDTTFEIDTHDTTGRKCRFYCVDPGSQNSNLFSPFNGLFLQAYISGQTNERRNQISLIDMMKKYNHTKVDILKMDIESSEFNALKAFLSESDIDDKKTSVCQILVELHYFAGSLQESWLNIFELLEKKGFRMFAKEANYYCPVCHEFSYLHLSCFKQYGLDEGSSYFTYFV